MSVPPFRALVLAAGLGTRLRPLTERLPKPLMPVLGVPLVVYTLEALVEAGCSAAVLNLHHLGEAIRHDLGDSYRGMPLHYSWEPRILGTLGALAPLAEFFADHDPVVVINGDSLSRWPLAELLSEHRRSGAAATLLVSETADPEKYGGGVGLSAHGNIVALRGHEVARPRRFRVFTGAQVLTSRYLAGLELREQDLVADLYLPLLARGEALRAVSTRQPWHDLGSPLRYLAGVLDELRRRQARAWISAEAEVAAGAQVVESVIEAGAQVAPGAQVERSLILRGARIGEGARVEGSIIGFDAEVAAGASVRDQLASRSGAATTVCCMV